MSDMAERGFGTGHMLDMKPTQVDIDGEVHNVLGAPSIVAGASIPQPITMCGIRLDHMGDPVSAVTTCNRCAILAAFQVVSYR